jgi:hypothetical protein
VGEAGGDGTAAVDTAGAVARVIRGDKEAGVIIERLRKGLNLDRRHRRHGKHGRKVG